uniref:Uncharacterized protein n=1 Tax=Anopheles atroparvus TaxID=41427 RepID=A0A182JJ60_ANOAO
MRVDVRGRWSLTLRISELRQTRSQLQAKSTVDVVGVVFVVFVVFVVVGVAFITQLTSLVCRSLWSGAGCLLRTGLLYGSYWPAVLAEFATNPPPFADSRHSAGVAVVFTTVHHGSTAEVLKVESGADGGTSGWRRYYAKLSRPMTQGEGEVVAYGFLASINRLVTPHRGHGCTSQAQSQSQSHLASVCLAVCLAVRVIRSAGERDGASDRVE